MEYILKNYIDDNNTQPILNWLYSLDKTTRKRILLRLERLKNGNFGDYKQISEFLYELRFTFGAGYRVYFTIESNIIILLINGSNKKTQTKDIKLANEILTKLKGNKNEKY